jgi:ABC-type sugar transport system substrate-binding protein
VTDHVPHGANPSVFVLCPLIFRGFSDAIAEHPGQVVFKGIVMVAEDNQAAYTLSVESAISESSPDATATWDNIGLLLCGASQMADAMSLIGKHPNVILGTFDVSDSMYAGIELGNLKFGIDQQPFLQGALPVYLLTYGMHGNAQDWLVLLVQLTRRSYLFLAAYSQQALTNTVIETGSRFITEKPSADEKVCESNYFTICSM